MQNLCWWQLREKRKNEERKAVLLTDMHPRLTLLALVSLAGVFGFFVGVRNSLVLQDDPGAASTHSATLKARPKVWISMSLCFGETTAKHGKHNYPYADVTLLSILIWNYFYPPGSGEKLSRWHRQLETAVSRKPSHGSEL